MANSVDPDQSAPIGAVCSVSTLFASILNSSVMLGNYLQKTTSADDIIRCIFSWRLELKKECRAANIAQSFGYSLIDFSPPKTEGYRLVRPLVRLSSSAIH